MKRLDLIIDALYKTKLLFEAHGQYPHTLREVSEALAAARELRELKPVGYMDSKGLLFNDTTHPHLNIPLYALEAALAQPEQEPCKCIDEFWCATFDRCKRNE